ncbi:TD and POZ domain-containing protein 3 [Caerostris extrusa]|uniref:TD and POZ domain-containing protein 3 n=1 Tax=Caerostris extrusa TaxID=172846 RepID=A0AAV4XBQ2_CAEEX|nr:TD and POZ domain-containing protein 3 [Caerostris extrusa]
MVLFPILWSLEDDLNNFKDKKKEICNLTLDSEWSLECVWKTNTIPTPDYMVIRRMSTTEEVFIAVNLQFHYGFLPHISPEIMMDYFDICQRNGVKQTENEESCGFQIKSMHFLQMREPTAEIKLRSVNNVYLTKLHLITGTINISENLSSSLINFENVEKMMGFQKDSLMELSKDFLHLLDQGASSFADMNLKCGFVTVPAHKSILAARSPVFAAMFETEMIENLTNVVDITDMDVCALRNMLTFMYSGRIENLTIASAGDLLFAADKYQLQGLKSICRDFLKSKLSLQNVLMILAAGDLYDPVLKAIATGYICNECDFSALEETEEWISLLKEKPSVAAEVLVQIVKSKDKKRKTVKKRKIFRYPPI